MKKILNKILNKIKIANTRKKWVKFFVSVLDFKNISFYRNKNKNILENHARESSKIYIDDKTF